MTTLVLLRHGESTWNKENRFTGWVDVDLTPKGEEEARPGDGCSARRALLPDVLHTSLQRRLTSAGTYGLGNVPALDADPL